MDAVEFLKNFNRMCSLNSLCSECKADEYCILEYGKSSDPEKLVKIVEEWAKENPVKTRQTEFLKIFPKAKVAVADNREVVLAICPKQIDNTITLPSCVGKKCVECEKDYWLQEVE